MYLDVLVEDERIFIWAVEDCLVLLLAEFDFFQFSDDGLLEVVLKHLHYVIWTVKRRGSGDDERHPAFMACDQGSLRDLLGLD